MATLVLSTIGTALGGPVGSAIGALIGQSIDQQLLAPVRRGPRVGDLSVQTSSYGTQIPRIYGTMRVAGSVIWSTDLIETSNENGTKRGPDVTYSYSVSLAVALSSRKAQSIGRIWADGQLIRGAAGDLKVDATLRFHDGDEDQAIDPVIASVESIANTPAYRGLTLAVFENLDLSTFGNRIPFLTFEIVADDEASTVGVILSDASAEAIEASDAQQVIGYAAYGGSIRAAIEPLVDAFDVSLVEEGDRLRSVDQERPIEIADDDLGFGWDGDAPPRLQRERLPVESASTALCLSYYDPARDYQTGETRASIGQSGGIEKRGDLPVVIDAGRAKALAESWIARDWARRDRATVRLAPRFIGMGPGSALKIPRLPGNWAMQKLSIEGFVVVAELRPISAPAISLPADPGRIVPNPDVVAAPPTLALFDVPDVLGVASNGPVVLCAASSPSPGWKPRSLQIGMGGPSIVAQSARRKSMLGRASSLLPPAGTELFDERDSVDVVLIDPDQWLTSADDDAIAQGANLAILGSELIQFGRATPIGSGTFRLERLLRGRFGTEWAIAGHAVDESFCLVELGTLQPIPAPLWSVGGQISADCGTASCAVELSAESVRPYMPTNLRASVASDGGLMIEWTRRTRAANAWIDEVDAPIGEMQERYRISVVGPASNIELNSAQPQVVIPASDIANLGAGAVTIEVRQIGDFLASRPTNMTYNLS